MDDQTIKKIAAAVHEYGELMKEANELKANRIVECYKDAKKRKLRQNGIWKTLLFTDLSFEGLKEDTLEIYKSKYGDLE